MKVYLTPNSAYTINRKGEQERVEAINVPLADGCSCDFDCCFGYISLPNYNSISGDVDNYYAMYFVDGEPVYDTVANVRAAITLLKNNTLVTATSVSIAGCPTADITVLAPFQLTASVLPSTALQTGTWVSGTPATATVSATGLVTPVADGTTIITFTSTDGALTATCTVTVAEA